MNSSRSREIVCRHGDPFPEPYVGDKAKVPICLPQFRVTLQEHKKQGRHIARHLAPMFAAPKAEGPRAVGAQPCPYAFPGRRLSLE